MPRRKRMYLAGLPYHRVQRGNNRNNRGLYTPLKTRCYLPLFYSRLKIALS